MGRVSDGWGLDLSGGNGYYPFMDHRTFIRRELKRTGWSQGTLARAIGMLPQNLNRYLNNRERGIRQATKDRIDNALKGAKK